MLDLEGFTDAGEELKGGDAIPERLSADSETS